MKIKEIFNCWIIKTKEQFTGVMKATIQFKASLLFYFSVYSVFSTDVWSSKYIFMYIRQWEVHVEHMFHRFNF